jgi:hypothetical protein
MKFTGCAAKSADGKARQIVFLSQITRSIGAGWYMVARIADQSTASPSYVMLKAAMKKHQSAPPQEMDLPPSLGTRTATGT